MAQKYSSSNSKIYLNSKLGGAVSLILAALLLALKLLTQPDPPLAPSTAQQQAFPTDPPSSPTVKAARAPWTDVEGGFDYYVLALSWEPAFCETKPDKGECATQSAERYDATHFVLHGLWPSVKGDDGHTFSYCNLSKALIQQDQAGDWCDMPHLPLSEAVWKELTILMPGAASCLHNHEWYKHGVCAGMAPDAYFALSNRLVTLFARTRFNRYVADQTGKQVSRRQVLDQFDAEFGQGASAFLSLKCTRVNGASLLTEIQLVLKSDLAELNDFAQAFPDKPVQAQGNCPQQFKIDRVGVGN